MSEEQGVPVNVRQAVPFFNVVSMEASLRFYVDGLGFVRVHEWIDEGKLRWCWLRLGEAAVMLQEYRPERVPEGKRGLGVTICFMCVDALALYHAFRARGLAPTKPFVGNNLWVTTVQDPDGYRLDFESPTDVPEETEYEEGSTPS